MFLGIENQILVGDYLTIVKRKSGKVKQLRTVIKIIAADKMGGYDDE